MLRLICLAPFFWGIFPTSAIDDHGDYTNSELLTGLIGTWQIGPYFDLGYYLQNPRANENWDRENNDKLVGKTITVYEDGYEINGVKCPAYAIGWSGSSNGTDLSEFSRLPPKYREPFQSWVSIRFYTHPCKENPTGEKRIWGKLEIIFNKENALVVFQPIDGPAFLLKRGSFEQKTENFSPVILGSLPDSFIGEWQLTYSFALGISAPPRNDPNDLRGQVIKIEKNSFSILGINCQFDRLEFWGGDTKGGSERKFEQILLSWNQKSDFHPKCFQEDRYVENDKLDDLINGSLNLYSNEKQFTLTYEPAHGPEFVLKAVSD